MAKRLYVGSLPFDMTEDQLHEIFSQLGKVSSTRLIRDRSTGQSRGFGFVEMESETDAQTAIEKLNGSPIGSRKMTVNEARPMEEMSGGKSGSFGGRGRGTFGNRGSGSYGRRNEGGRGGRERSGGSEKGGNQW